VHFKQEQSKSDKVESYFTFSWDLSLTFDRYLSDSSLNPQFRVLDISFHEQTTREHKVEMQKAFGVRRKKASPLSHLPFRIGFNLQVISRKV